MLHLIIGHVAAAVDICPAVVLVTNTDPFSYALLAKLTL